MDPAQREGAGTVQHDPAHRERDGFFTMLGREAQGTAMPAKMPPPTGKEGKIFTNDPSHDPQRSRCLDTLLLKVWRSYVGGKACNTIITN